MALTYDQISAITEKKFLPKLYDNIFDSNPLLQRAKSKFMQKVDGGERVLVPLNYAQASASGWFAGADTISTTDNEVLTSAEYTWKQAYASVIISRRDELKNSGDRAILSLVKSKIKIAEKSLADKLSTGLYSAGSDADAFVGLRDIVATDQTVGGISQTDYSWWRGQVDSSTTTLTMLAVQNQFTNATVNNDSPTVIVSTRANYDRYYSLLQPAQRFTDSETAKGGFSNLMFNGIPWAPDSYCPASHIFGLNEQYLHFIVHKDEDFRFDPFQRPPNQNVKIGAVFFMGTFGSSNNRMHFKLSAVAA